jgi:hypothetical protein
MAAEVATVSAERIGVELRRMFVDPNRAVALDLLRETKLLARVLSEVDLLDSADFAETRRVLAALDEPTLALALAALLSRVGDPHAPGAVGRRLRYTNREIERATWLLAHLPILGDAPHAPWPRLQRVLVHDGAAELIALQAAIAGPADAALAFARERVAWPAERLNPPPLIDGSDLIQHGLAPSPDFTRLLEAVRDAQLRGEIETTLGALTFVQRMLDEGIPAEGLDAET